MGFNKKFFQTGGIVASSPSGAASTDNFDVVTYTGNGGTQSISSLDFQPDLVWLKSRSRGTTPYTGSHYWFDSIRGALQRIKSDGTDAESTFSNSLTSFDSNGFSLGSGSNVNYNGDDFVAWCWKASDTTVTDSSTGDITADIRANTNAGFSIIKYTGNNTSGTTVPHGLNSQPDLVIIKSLDSAQNWHVYVNGVTSDFQDLRLNSTNGLTTVSAKRFVHASFTDSVIALGNSGGTNAAETYIGYCFHSVDGYQKIGSYNGGASGNAITGLGFEPRFLIIKRTNSTGGWIIFDSVRDTTDPRTEFLGAHQNLAESTLTGGVDFDSDGFTLQSTNSVVNTSGGIYIYLAIA